MSKVIDVASLFEKYAVDYLKKHPKLQSDKNSDDALQKVYDAFNKTRFTVLNGLTPENYYESLNVDLVEVAKRTILNNKEVNDYLIDAIIKSDCEDRLIALLDDSLKEELLLFSIELLERINSKKCVNRLIDLLFSTIVDDCVKNRAAEVLSNYADLIADELLCRMKKENKSDSIFADILSNVTVKREDIKSLIISGLFNGDKIPEYCAYIVKYGDDSVLEKLYDYISTVNDYVNYNELSIAIDALGGFLEEKRDFSQDKDYLKIVEASIAAMNNEETDDEHKGDAKS